jgi:CubicO group peptidase (beta-lactamase class C family)
MIRSSSILLLFALLLGSCDSTKNESSWRKEPLTTAKPESQGFSSERLGRIDSLFQKFVDQRAIAGVTALVARKGKIVYFRSTGYNDLENKVPLEKDAIFRIASQTKAITSVAIMMLFEEGRISLNDPISMHLPEFSNPKVITGFNKKDSSFTSQAAKRAVTIHDLLTHTSGYCYPGSGGEAVNAIYAKLSIVNGVPEAVSTLKEEMRKIALAPLAHEPGEKFSYGLSTDILGYLVETVSGQSLEDFFRTKIFEPLEMADTYFQLPVEKHSRLMLLYEDNIKGDGVQKSTGQYIDYPLRKGIYFSGGGGLFWARRADLAGALRCFIFGHATYEQLLSPFRGLTAKAVLYEVAEDWLQQPLSLQLADVDRRLAGELAAGAYADPRDLHPLPLMGFPGVTAENENAAYYDDTWQFRPGRRQK